MRKLIVLMQASADGFVGSDAGVPWQMWNYEEDWPWDAALRQDFNATFQAVDTILLSRFMVHDYVAQWTGISALYPANPDFAFAKRASMPKRSCSPARPSRRGRSAPA